MVFLAGFGEKIIARSSSVSRVKLVPVYQIVYCSDLSPPPVSILSLSRLDR